MKKKSSGKYYFLEGFLLCLILSTPFSFVKRAYLLVVEDSAFIGQRLAMEDLRKHIDSEGSVPNNLSDIVDSHSDFYGNIFYYPEAWDKPGQILLLSNSN